MSNKKSLNPMDLGFFYFVIIVPDLSLKACSAFCNDDITDVLPVLAKLHVASTFGNIDPAAN